VKGRHHAVAGVPLVELGTGALLEEVYRRRVRLVSAQMQRVAEAAQRGRYVSSRRFVKGS
jgi:hypothetical protein